MKRKCLIEEYSGDPSIDCVEKKTKRISINEETMHRNTAWYKDISNAEKTCMNCDKIKKVHYKFNDEREMVEEYNIDTQVLLRRAWKQKGKLGGEGKWFVEIGDPMPDATPDIEAPEIIESKDQPIVSRRNTKINLEWRIRNLPYPIETYCISASNEDKCIIVRTTNKKYYKKLEVPELLRFNLPAEQANIQSSHKFNTLVILYKKPQLLMDFEKEWYEELKKVKPVKDLPDPKTMPNDCKMQ